MSLALLAAGSAVSGALNEHVCPRRFPTDAASYLHAAEYIHFVLFIAITIYFISGITATGLFFCSQLWTYY